MLSYRINILNPKVTGLIEELAKLKLISIEKKSKEDFFDVVKRIQSKNFPPVSLKEITKEVEMVRKKRYGK